MNEYQRSEYHELLRQILDLDSMLKDNEEDMNQLISYLRNLKEKQLSKYYQLLEDEDNVEEDNEEPWHPCYIK